MIQTLNVTQSEALHLMPLCEFNQGNAMLMRLWHFHLVIVVIREETTEVRKISCESKYRKSQQNEKKEEYKAVKHL